MNRLHVFAAAGLVALAGCTDQSTEPATVAPPGTLTPSFLVVATPIGVGNSAAQQPFPPGLPASAGGIAAAAIAATASAFG